MKRCPYCGHRCHGRTCRNCADLSRIEAAMTREPTARARWRATCPKCGEYAKPGRKRCALCRTALYPSDAFLAALKAPREDARRLVDVLAEDFDAPGWRDALDSPGASWNR